MRILLLNLKKNFAFDFFVIKLIIEAQKSTHTHYQFLKLLTPF